MSVKTDQLAVIKQVADKIVALQAAVAGGGMNAADEAEVDAALTALSQLADPATPNPAPFPPDPGATP